MKVRFSEAASSSYRYPLLIKSLLFTPLATAPEQEIVYRTERRHTYAEFNRRLGRLANALSRLGAGAGSVVAMLDWDSHRYLECFFSVPMIGAVLQTVNVRLSSEQIHYTLSHAGAEFVLVHRDFMPLVDSIRSRLPRVRGFVLLEDSGSAGPRPDWLAVEYEEWLGTSSDEFAFPDFDENAVATTFYTTGTTGAPKGVCFSHRQIVLHTLAITAALASPAHGQACRHGDVYMPLTPLFHVHAWGMPYLATLLGLKQVYPGRYVPEDILALRHREGVTFSHCVPTILQMLLAAAARNGGSLRGWKLCIGGSALSSGLAQEALEHGIDVFAGYGMSETAPVLTLSRVAEAGGDATAGNSVERRCQAGLPIPLVDLRLFDADGRELARDGKSVGEVVVRAPWATMAYVGDAEASDALWRGGYLHTQDVAMIDRLGYLRITDRIKDVIKSGGEWVSSLELESLISQHPGVLEVAVVAIPDDYWGERPHAVVVPKPDWRNRLTATDVKVHVAGLASAGKIASYAVPGRVTLVEVLPRTSVGKINKRALREPNC